MGSQFPAPAALLCPVLGGSEQLPPVPSSTSSAGCTGSGIPNSSAFTLRVQGPFFCAVNGEYSHQSLGKLRMWEKEQEATVSSSPWHETLNLGCCGQTFVLCVPFESSNAWGSLSATGTKLNFTLVPRGLVNDCLHLVSALSPPCRGFSAWQRLLSCAWLLTLRKVSELSQLSNWDCTGVWRFCLLLLCSCSLCKGTREWIQQDLLSYSSPTWGRNLLCLLSAAAFPGGLGVNAGGLLAGEKESDT